MNTQTIPYGYCKCGCGQKTTIAKQSITKLKHINGEPVHFIKGHGRRLPAVKRFWKKVNKKNPDECWNWKASTNIKGYGQFRLDATESGKGRLVLASRFSWEIHHGSIPLHLCVLHKCDNPLCVNPQHLWLGTLADNANDMYHKGRGKKPKHN